MSALPYTMARRRPTTQLPGVSMFPTQQSAPTSFVPQSVQQQAQGVNTSQPPAAQAPQQAQPSPYSPAPYPSQPNYFQPRSGIPVTPVPGSSTDYQTQRLREVAGSFADVLAPQGGDPLLRKDVPLLEAGLNYENMLKAEADRERGYGELARGRGAVGSSSDEQLAMEIAMGRAQSGTPWNQQFLDQQTAGLKDRAALARKNALGNLEADFARRGISGVDPALVRANMEQDLLGQLSGQISDLHQNAASQRDQSERAALEQLMGISQEHSQRRSGFDEALSKVFLDTERAPVDLSGLLQPVPYKAGQATLTEGKTLKRTYKDLGEYPKGLTARPESMTQKQWQHYINADRPENMSSADWKADLIRRGILDEKGRWLSSLQENKFAQKQPDEYFGGGK